MRRTRGLTLIEVLIVVMVLTILAAVVTPQLSRAGQDSRLETLKNTLLDVRAQLRLYASQHEGKFPRLSEFVPQMLQANPAKNQDTAQQADHGMETDKQANQCILGPYLSGVPFNPYTGGKRIGNGAPGTSDWYYNETSGLFRANHEPAFIEY